MHKPDNFDTVAASLAFEPLTLGGHACIIKGVEETKSKAGRDMLKVAIDMAEEDPQAGYYAEKFANDDRPNKKWPCVSYVVTEDSEGGCSRQLAGFVTSIEESNPGFKFPWDNPGYLKGKCSGRRSTRTTRARLRKPPSCSGSAPSSVRQMPRCPSSRSTRPRRARRTRPTGSPSVTMTSPSDEVKHG